MVVFSFGAIGQSDSTTQGLDSATTKNLSEPFISQTALYYPKYRIGLDAKFGAASKEFSSNQLVEIGTGNYLTESIKSDLIEAASSQLRLGYHQHLEIGYFERLNQPLTYPEKDFKQGLSIYQTAFSALDFNGSALALALRGNAPFAGQDLDLSGSTFEDWYYTGIKYHFSFNLNSRSRAFMGVGILAGHGHALYNFENTSLFTAEDGSFVELNGGYELQQANTTSSLGVAGLGVGLDFETTLKNGKHWLTLSAQEFGLMVWTQTESAKRDSSYRFEGIFIDNFESLSDSLLQAEGDAIIDDLLFNDGENYTRLTPFRVAARYSYQLDKKYFKSVFTEVNYRHLAGYSPQFQIGANAKTGQSDLLSCALAYGGFNELSFSVDYHLWFSKYAITAGLTNAFGVVAPGLSGGTFGHLGLHYIW
jgi:hypothetical protein